MNEWLALLVGTLGIWRVTHLVTVEEGPFHVFAWLRMCAARRPGSYGQELLGCHYCASLVVAAPVATLLASDWRYGLILWPALSAGAVLLERYAGLHLPDLVDEPLAQAGEHATEENHVRLRTIKSADGGELEAPQGRATA